jgi:hypothetical protein
LLFFLRRCCWFRPLPYRRHVKGFFLGMAATVHPFPMVSASRGRGAL